MFEENRNPYNNDTDHNATQPESRSAGQSPNQGYSGNTHGQYSYNPNHQNSYQHNFSADNNRQ